MECVLHQEVIQDLINQAPLSEAGRFFSEHSSRDLDIEVVSFRSSDILSDVDLDRVQRLLTPARQTDWVVVSPRWRSTHLVTRQSLEEARTAEEYARKQFSAFLRNLATK